MKSQTVIDFFLISLRKKIHNYSLKQNQCLQGIVCGSALTLNDPSLKKYLRAKNAICTYSNVQRLFCIKPGNLGTLGERYMEYLYKSNKACCCVKYVTSSTYSYVFIINSTRKSIQSCKIFLLDMDKLFFRQHGNKLSNNKRE